MKLAFVAIGLSFVSSACAVDNIRAGGNDGGASVGLQDASSSCSPPSVCDRVEDGSSGADAPAEAAVGTVSVVAGGATGGGDGVGSAADVGRPAALAYDGTNSVYIADMGLRIRRVDLTTTAVTTLTGSHHATAVAFDGSANALYYIDSIDSVLSKIDVVTGTTSVVAGALGASGAVDGIGTVARFQHPGRLTLSNGKIYLTDGCAIRSFDIATAAVTTVAGNAATCGYKEGPVATALFGSAALGPMQGGPLGIAVGPAQTLFVADRGNFVVRAIHLDTATTELVAGSSYGHADGEYKAASFQEVKDVVWDGARGRLYVAGTGGTIRRIDLAGNATKNTVTTIAGVWPGETTFSPGKPGRLVRPEAIVLVGSDLIGGDTRVLFRVTGL